jgi:phosphinothricin acetyltransferase
MIRRATLADLESITVIYNEAILEGGFTGDLQPLSIERRRAWFFDHRDRYSIFVKSMGNSLVGYASLSPYRNGRNAFNETCEISYYLVSQQRGLGIGKELVGHAIEHAGHLGFRLIVAMILECNQRSIDLLLEFGFSISGRLPKAAKINGEYFDHVFLSCCTTPDSYRPMTATLGS